MYPVTAESFSTLFDVIISIFVEFYNEGVQLFVFFGQPITAEWLEEFDLLGMFDFLIGYNWWQVLFGGALYFSFIIVLFRLVRSFIPI